MQQLTVLISEAGAVILKIAYGYTIEAQERDHLVHISNLALENFSVAGTPGAWLVDMIPARMYYLLSPSYIETDNLSQICPNLVPRGRIQAHCKGMEKELRGSGR